LVGLVVLDGLRRGFGGGCGEESPWSHGAVPKPEEGIIGRPRCRGGRVLDGHQLRTLMILKEENLGFFQSGHMVRFGKQQS